MKRLNSQLMHGMVTRAAPLTSSIYVTSRSIIPGQIPTEGSSSQEGDNGWTMRRGHHLQSSVGQHTPFVTACGRVFDVQMYYEVLQACCDQQWMMAIQRELREDKEYLDYLRQNGGVARDLRVLTDSTNHDDEFMVKLKERLKTEKGMSLSLCAVQESYKRIRDKRDKHETRVAADGGRDPYASMKSRQQGEFGMSQPQF